MKNEIFNQHFESLSDPRSHINKLHELNDILFIGLTSVLCGADTWKQMEEFAIAREDFLKKHIDLSNGIPSDDTINRVFSAIDTEEFEACFIKWVSATFPLIGKKGVIAIDGKTVRGAKSSGKKSPIHIVSAWSSQLNIALGQKKVSEKSNEITAIPELLDILDTKNSIITIDAIGTQTSIAKKIIEGGADYILAVKENQLQLLEDIQDEFRFSKTISSNASINGDHGRIESRNCSVIDNFQFLDTSNEKWTELNQIIRIESTREFKGGKHNTEKSVRYYISSLDLSPEEYQKHIRSHWGIENKLHWVLDVGFSEDASRKRKENAAQNFSILLKIALNLLKQDKKTKQGIAGKRLKAAWNNSYLEQILAIKV